MGIFYLLTAASLWGLIGPVSKIMFSHDISPLETAFWRGNVAGAAYLIHWIIARYPLPKHPSDWLKIVLFGVFGVALLEGSFVYAVKTGGAALASVLLYSAPIWVNIAGWLIFGERVQKKRFYSLTMTLVGVIGLCLWGSTATFSQEALIWGLLSGLSYAGFYIAGKLFFRHHHPVVVFMIAFPTGSLALLPFLLNSLPMTTLDVLTGIFNFPRGALIACLFMGIFSTYLPYLLYSAGLQLVQLGRAAIITMVEPLVSVSLAALFWGETFSLAGYFFAALVIMGVTLS